MTRKARTCKGCKALPLNHNGSGECLLGRSFVTSEDIITVPLGPSCSYKATTHEKFNYKLSILAKENQNK